MNKKHRFYFKIIKKKKISRQKKIMQNKEDISKKSKNSLKLYWVTETDCENWFVIAKSTKNVKKLYENSDSIKAEFIIHVPSELYNKHYTNQEKVPIHAQLPILQDLGFKSTSTEDFVRVLEFKGRKFTCNDGIYGENAGFPEETDWMSKERDGFPEENDGFPEKTEAEQVEAIMQGFKKALYEKKKIRDPPGATLKLFWVTDALGSEDWFIIAATAENATKFYSQYETLDIKFYSIKAEEIMKISNEIFKKHYSGENTPIHAQTPILEDLGFKLISPKKNITKVVEYKGRLFCEGVTQMMIDNKGNAMFIMNELKCYPKTPLIIQEALSDPEKMKYYSDGLYRLFRIKN